MGGNPKIYRFDAFALDTANRQLSRGGEPLELGSRYFDALTLLLREKGALVSKERFMDEVWAGVPVTDEALTQCIRTLRRALNDDAARPRYIQTVPKHGYRFVGTLEGVEPPPLGKGISQPLPSRIAGATTLAGLAAGVFAGLVYGAIAGTGGSAGVLVLAAMIGALGVLAGAGLGIGIAAALAWRGWVDAWLLAGGVVGGLAIGALGNLLGRESVALVTGRSLGPVTGPLEGAIIGLATGLVAWTALSGRSGRAVLVCAVASGLAAGALIHLAGGALLAESLWIVQLALPETQLAMERLGGLLGASTFSALMQGLTALVEGMVFALTMGLAMLAARPR